MIRVDNVALYVFVSPIAAIMAAIMAVVFGLPLYLVVLSFLVAGPACALLIALGRLLFLRGTPHTIAQAHPITMDPYSLVAGPAHATAARHHG